MSTASKRTYGQAMQEEPHRKGNTERRTNYLGTNSVRARGQRDPSHHAMRASDGAAHNQQRRSTASELILMRQAYAEGGRGNIEETSQDCQPL